jgi:hypothetical protein
MDNEEISIIIWCWHDLRTDAPQLRLVRVDTGEDVPLRDNSFLLRISIDAKVSVTRCYIRHIASGREVYIQSSRKLREFVKACLLINGGTTEPTDSDTTGA